MDSINNTSNGATVMTKDSFIEKQKETTKELFSHIAQDNTEVDDDTKEEIDFRDKDLARIRAEWIEPYKKLAKRLGVEIDNLEQNLHLLSIPSRQWIERDIVPLMNKDVYELFNEINYSFHWEQVARDISETLELGLQGEALNKQLFNLLYYWAKFVWAMENFVYEKLIDLGIEFGTEQEEIIHLAYPKRKKYKTIDDLLNAVIKSSKAASEEVSFTRQTSLAIVPPSYTMAIQDNQLVTPVIGMKAGQGIALTFRKTKFNGQVLDPWNLKILKINETQEQVTEADLAVAFAVCEVAKNNRVTDITGRFTHDSFTIPEVVSLMFRIRPDNIKPDGVYYQFVKDAIYKLAANRYNYDASQLVESRGVEIPNGFVLSNKDAPLLDFTEAKISKGGKAIDAFLLKGSFVYSILQMLGWRNTIQMRPEFMPKNIKHKRLIVLAFEMLSRASNRGKASNNINLVYLSAKGRDGKYSLYGFMEPEGWIDPYAQGTTPTDAEKKKEGRQRKAVQNILDVWIESGCFSVVINPESPKDRKLTHYYARLDRSKEPELLE